MSRVLLLSAVAVAFLGLGGGCDSSGSGGPGGSTTDGGPVGVSDGGNNRYDGGRPTPDGGSTSTDGGSTSTDGGSTSADGGTTSDDGGSADDGGSQQDAGTCTGGTGGLSGKACAPDQTTSIANALVAIDATDCQGNPVHLETHAGSDGTWTVQGIPAGNVQVTITVGSFVQHQTAQVVAGTTVALSADKTCFTNAVKMAVVTGTGDHIETLLTSLGFTPDLFEAHYSSTNPTPAALGFLGNLSQMQQYQIIFIDCGALHHYGKVDLGTNASTIISNLRSFVQGGGSLYASDWAAIFLAIAYPQQVVLRLAGVDGGAPSTTLVTPAASPFATNSLVGFAAQQVTGTVQNMTLASYLGSMSVPISFPVVTGGDGGVSARHWAMLDSAPSPVSSDIAGSATVCADSTCMTAGALQSNVPLSISYKPDAMRTRGGNVIFTSFHNISQPTDDVKKILQYLIFRL
jgi:hypothetical protein